jgi:hypothetical protein
MKRIAQCLLLATAIMMPSVRVARGEDFYEARLRGGQASFHAKLYPDALDQLRIAAFGFLDRPPLLSEALVYLTLTQVAAGKGSDADATVARFLEVERRFSPYAQLQLDPAARVEFEALLTRRVAFSTLQGFPGLSSIASGESQRLAKLSPADRWKALEGSALKEPNNPYWAMALAREAALKPDPKAVIEWSGRALALDPLNADARALRAQAYASRGECAAALADIASIDAKQIATRPAVQADRFVCLVETKDWSQAEEAWKNVPSDLTTRPDVVRAQGRLVASRPAS